MLLRCIFFYIFAARMESCLSYNMFDNCAGPLVGTAITAITPPHSVFLSNLTGYSYSTELFSSLCVMGDTGRMSAALPTTVAACLSFDELYYCDIRLGEGGCRYFYL